jgi:hypothetical protein
MRSRERAEASLACTAVSRLQLRGSRWQRLELRAEDRDLLQEDASIA